MKLKRLFKILITVFAFSIVFWIFSAGLKRYDSFSKMNDFFMDKDAEYDAFFLGTSHVLDGVNPMELWNDYGITSYNLGWNCNTIPLDYWLLKLCTKKHKPKIVFVDILQIYTDSRVDSNYVYAHGALDLFAPTPEKILAIADLFEKSELRTEFLFPYYLYHNRWQELNFRKFKENVKTSLARKTDTPTKGMDLRVGIKTPEIFLAKLPQYSGKNSLAMDYAEKIIDYCRENDIIPVFMLIPYSAQDGLSSWKTALEEKLKKENVDFLDMSDTVNFDIDQYDQNFHLNPSGARKATAFIGKYLSEKMNFQSHKDDLKYSKWNSDYEDYKKYYSQRMKSQTELKNVLLLLYSSEFQSEIKLSKDYEFDEIETELIKQLEGNVTISPDLNTDFDVSIKVFSKNDGSFLFEKVFRLEYIQAE